MTDPLAELLRNLRRDYLRDSTERVAELRGLLDRVQKGDAGAMDELKRALHKLAGSGGSYGFAAVSTASRAGEHVARRVLESGTPPGTDDLASLEDSIRQVADAFAAARAAGESLTG
jgi:HPt (histidine-containing phosphotransfer) domain-containing protein